MKTTLLPCSHKTPSWSLILLLFSVCMLTACAPLPASLAGRISEQNQIAQNTALWSGQTLKAGRFTLAAARKSNLPVQRIYIEGDGRAYITRSQASGNPTPVHPVALNLAMNDATPSILYLARPCQWTHESECRTMPDDAPWTTGRFTQEVADAYTQLVDEQTAGEPVELVGFSGGAWVALQVAANLPNVTHVYTVAGNLMPDALNQQSKVTSIPVAPYPQNSRLKSLPITAYVGANDDIITSGITNAFIQSQQPTNLQTQTISGAAHITGWENIHLPPTKKEPPEGDSSR